jgi:hypothetical protein
MRTFSVTNRTGQTTTVHSDLTDSEAADLCCRGTSSFGRDLARTFEDHRTGRSVRALTGVQISYLHIIADEQRRKLADADLDRAGVDVVTQDETRVEAIIAHLRAALANMADRIKMPAMVLADADKVEYKIELSVSDPRRPVKVFHYLSRKYLGYVATDGLWMPTVAASHYHGLVPLLIELAADPVGVARRSGYRTGKCCYCRIKLTDDRSLAVGCGKICATHYGWLDQWKAAVVQKGIPCE